ncbi:MAG: hypothetical protein PVJ55_08905, partial [Anaerolineae bacterium]
IVPVPNAEPPADDARHLGEITPGARVRIVRPPHWGLVGTVLDIPSHARRTTTGARARCAEVNIGQDEPVLVPLVNLAILS